MKLVKFALTPPVVAISVALCAALSAQAITDPVWGEAWNSKIGKANCTIKASSNYGSSAPVGNVFDNNVGSRYLAKSGAAEFPVDVTIVVNEAYAPETPDLVLKKYAVYGIQGDGTGRFPRDWVVYGSNDGGVTWDTVAIDSQALITTDKYVDSLSRKCYEVDISGNVLPYRAYKFHFLHDNGGNFLEIGEIVLFGEIKEHEDKILYKADAFNGIYDGYEHTVSVTPLSPNTTVTYSRSGAAGSWTDTPPTFKEPGEHTVFIHLTSPGLPDADDSVTVVIEEPPRENVNITKEVRLAGTRKGDATLYREVAFTGYGGFGDHADYLVDGTENQRYGCTGNGTFDYTISDAYRPGDAVVATAVLFVVGVANKSDGFQNYPRVYTLSGWNAELNDGAGGWELIASFDKETSPEWTDADKDANGNYRRTVAFANTKVYRKYHFTFTGRTQMSEISLIGLVGAKASTAVNVFATDYDAEYDGYPHGINLEVVSPDEGVTVSYRLDESAEWTTTAPLFDACVVNTVPVYWKAEAEGYEPAAGCNTVTIRDAVRGAVDIGATVKAASVKSTGWNYEVSAVGRSGASDGNLQNIFTATSTTGVSFDRQVWTDNDTYTLTLTINPAYRPVDRIVASSIVFRTEWTAAGPKEIAVDTKTPEEILAEYGYYRIIDRGDRGKFYQVPDSNTYRALPSRFKLEASDDGGTWRTLLDNLDGEPWTVENIVQYSSVGAVMFEKAYDGFKSRRPARIYRLTFPKRTIISGIQLFGTIGLPPPGLELILR